MDGCNVCNIPAKPGAPYEKRHCQSHPALRFWHAEFGQSPVERRKLPDDGLRGAAAPIQMRAGQGTLDARYESASIALASAGTGGTRPDGGRDAGYALVFH